MIRLLRNEELAVVARLLQSRAELNSKYLEKACALRGYEMDDGGMGSLRFENLSHSKRVFGGRIADARYWDDDGVEVLISLIVDQNGDLYELEFAKTDFSALVSFPVPEELVLVSGDDESSR
jgi:hypothetical protein